MIIEISRHGALTIGEASKTIAFPIRLLNRFAQLIPISKGGERFQSVLCFQLSPYRR